MVRQTSGDELQLPEPSEACCGRAHRRLMKSFVDVRVEWAWMESPFGALFLARTRRGLCRLSFQRSEDELMAELASRLLLPGDAPSGLDRERRRLEAYFAGRHQSIDLEVDMRWGSAFQRAVLEATSTIPFGRVVSYGELAARLGRPRAGRAVGRALGGNPLPVVIPCHRVVASRGLGGYTGGLDIKQSLLHLEGVAADAFNSTRGDGCRPSS